MISTGINRVLDIVESRFAMPRADGIKPVGVHRMVAPSVACLCHLCETGTPSRAACGTSAANQLLNGFCGSSEGSPEWHGFIFDRTPEASARHHLLGDVGLGPHISTWYVVLLMCSMYICMFVSPCVELQ